jgi:ABC-type Fe3+-hydroxamate transport system substrate-binding protein
MCVSPHKPLIRGAFFELALHIALEYSIFAFMKYLYLAMIFWVFHSQCFATPQDQSPLRVVSLVPSLTTQIIELGKGNLLVGVTSYCPLEVRQKTPVIASAVNVQLEQLLLLKPDLVLTSSLVSPKIEQQLQRLGIATMHIPTPTNFTELAHQFLQLAHKLDAIEQAQVVLSKIESKILEINHTYSDSVERPKVLFQIGSRPIFVVLANTFMDDFITFNGAHNLAAELKQGTVAREWVLAGNPDAIILTTMGNDGSRERKEWQNFTSLKAVRNQHIYILDAEKACIPSPANFLWTLDTLHTLLQPIVHHNFASPQP